MLSRVWGLFRNPVQEWGNIREANPSVAATFGSHTFIFAAIPALAGFFGTTRIGWQIGAGDPVKLTVDSAGFIAIAYYLAMLAGVYVVGLTIRWMGQTYCNEPPTLDRCVALASHTATPLFLVGIMELFPILWLNLILGLPALGYTIYLFYTGVPVIFNADKDRAFLFASAVMGFGLVAFVALLAITALLWGFGFAPQFTS